MLDIINILQHLFLCQAMPACVTALTVEHAADEAPGARGTFFFPKSIGDAWVLV